MKTKVTRVLVMLEYEPGNPDNGEVFDLTALLTDITTRTNAYGPHLSLYVNACKNYSTPTPGAPAIDLDVSWGGQMGGEWIHGAAHLADVINSGMPDGERVASLRNKAKRLNKKAEDLNRDAMVAKLEQVAAIRHQHPIARITQSALTDVPTP